MKPEPDISDYLRGKFGERSEEAERLLAEHIQSHSDHIGRVARCVAFLAQGSIPELKRRIRTAHQDYRDVIFWAEYTDWTDTKPKRVRNFNRPFGQENEPG